MATRNNIISVRQRCDSEEQASRLFYKLVSLLEDVNHWHPDAWGRLSAYFQLYRREQIITGHTAAALDDFIQVKFPFLQMIRKQGDWVRIKAIKRDFFENRKFYEIKVQPSPSPCEKKKETAHFFTPAASNRIGVYQLKYECFVRITSSDIHLNTKTGSLIRCLQNILIGGLGKAGLSDLQWKLLAKGLMQKALQEICD